MCYFGTGLLWSTPCCNLNARPSVYHQKGVRWGRCSHLTTVMGTKEKAPWAVCMQSKNKNSPFLESQKSFESYLFLCYHWFLLSLRLCVSVLLDFEAVCCCWEEGRRTTSIPVLAGSSSWAGGCAERELVWRALGGPAVVMPLVAEIPPTAAKRSYMGATV